MPPTRVTVWNEFRHERNPDHPAATVYPDGIHAAVAEALLGQTDWSVRTATLDEPDHGLSDSVLDETDVLVWWAHMAHAQVTDTKWPWT